MSKANHDYITIKKYRLFSATPLLSFSLLQLFMDIQTLPSKPKIDKKNILILFLIITNLFLVSFLFLKKPTVNQTNSDGLLSVPTDTPISEVSDPTQNWQTYTNEEYRFQFNYPLDWKLASNDFSDNKSISLLSSIESDQRIGPEKPNSLNYYVSIDIINNNFNDWWSNLKLDPQYVKYEIRKIGQYTAYVTESLSDMFGNLQYFIEDKEKNILVNFILTPYEAGNNFSNQKLAYDTFLEILSTFKFTTPTSTTTAIPSDWIKETDSSLGISFYHPVSWFKYENSRLWSPSCKQYPDCPTLKFEKTQKTVEDLKSEICVNDGAVDNTDVTPQAIAIGEHSATLFFYGNAMGVGERSILISKENGQNFLINHLVSYNKQDVVDIDQILSTLEFIN